MSIVLSINVCIGEKNIKIELGEIIHNISTDIDSKFNNNFMNM